MDADDVLDGCEGDAALLGGHSYPTRRSSDLMDTAILRGNFADYAISYDSVSHQYTLVDQAPERDGTDIVHGVENFAFADGMKKIGQLVNTAPVLTQPIADQAVDEDATLSFSLPIGTFSDADAGDTLSFIATLADGSALPAWLQFDASTRTFTGTPDNSAVGRIET